MKKQLEMKSKFVKTRKRLQVEEINSIEIKPCRCASFIKTLKFRLYVYIYICKMRINENKSKTIRCSSSSSSIVVKQDSDSRRYKSNAVKD